MTSLESVEVVYYNAMETSTDINGNESNPTTHKEGYNILAPSNATTQPARFSSEYTHWENTNPEQLTNWQVKSGYQCFSSNFFRHFYYSCTIDFSFITCKNIYITNIFNVKGNRRCRPLAK